MLDRKSIRGEDRLLIPLALGRRRIDSRRRRTWPLFWLLDIRLIRHQNRHRRSRCFPGCPKAPLEHGSPSQRCWRLAHKGFGAGSFLAVAFNRSGFWFCMCSRRCENSGRSRRWLRKWRRWRLLARGGRNHARRQRHSTMIHKSVELIYGERRKLFAGDILGLHPC